MFIIKIVPISESLNNQKIRKQILTSKDLRTCEENLNILFIPRIVKGSEFIRPRELKMIEKHYKMASVIKYVVTRTFLNVSSHVLSAAFRSDRECVECSKRMLRYRRYQSIGCINARSFLGRSTVNKIKTPI